MYFEFSDLKMTFKLYNSEVSLRLYNLETIFDF